MTDGTWMQSAKKRVNVHTTLSLRYLRKKLLERALITGRRVKIKGFISDNRKALMSGV